MKRLIFVRHGKAEDGSPEISDFERSLTLKGKVISG
jgi:phosphohistidine phosphatase SixA